MTCLMGKKTTCIDSACRVKGGNTPLSALTGGVAGCLAGDAHLAFERGPRTPPNSQPLVCTGGRAPHTTRVVWGLRSARAGRRARPGAGDPRSHHSGGNSPCPTCFPQQPARGLTWEVAGGRDVPSFPGPRGVLCRSSILQVGMGAPSRWKIGTVQLPL